MPESHHRIGSVQAFLEDRRDAGAHLQHATTQIAALDKRGVFTDDDAPFVFGCPNIAADYLKAARESQKLKTADQQCYAGS